LAFRAAQSAKSPGKFMRKCLIASALIQYIASESCPSVFPVRGAKPIFADTGIFMRTEAKFLGQYINFCSRVIHMRLPANKNVLSIVFTHPF
jgi:hypothetical protein